jgi:hypothetical protein
VSALVGAAPAHAATTSVTQLSPFDFGCRAQGYGSLGPPGRCLRSADAPRRGQLTARARPSLSTHFLLHIGVDTAYVGDSAGLRIDASRPSRLLATVVARGQEAVVPSPFSQLRLCASLINRSGGPYGRYGSVCQPVATGGRTTLQSTFDGLNPVESPYRFVVWLAGSGRATLRSITYGLDATG